MKAEIVWMLYRIGNGQDGRKEKAKKASDNSRMPVFSQKPGREEQNLQKRKLYRRKKIRLRIVRKKKSRRKRRQIRKKRMSGCF